MPRTFAEELERLALGKRGQALEDLAPPPSPGLLSRLGRVLDYPGRKVREAVVGRPEASGRDFLRQLGIAGPNQRGLDVEDVLSFGAEVALDPLTYVAGIGAGTKGGKAAKALGKVEGSLRAAEDAVRLATNAKEATRASALVKQLTDRRGALLEETAQQGVPSALAKGLRGQAEAGQRSLLKLGIPFTGIEATAIRGAPVLGALGKIGGAVGQTSAFQGFRKLLDPKFGRLEETAPFYEQFMGRGLREGQGDVLDTARGFAGWEKNLASRIGADPADYNRGLVREIEDLAEIPEPGSFAGRFGEEMRERSRREILSGGKSKASKLTSETKAYFPRVPGPAGKKDLAKRGELQGLVPRRVTTRAGFQRAREKGLLEEFTEDANTILANEGRPEDFFQLDPALAFAERGAKGEASIAAAKLSTSLLDNFSRLGGAADDVDVADFIAAGPLRKWRGVELPESAADIAKALKGTDMDGLTVPRDVYDEFVKVAEKFSAPEEVEGVLKVFDKLTSVFRAAFTVPFPAYHIQNLMGDTSLSWLNGGANPGLILQALKKARDPAWLREAENLGIRGSATRWALDQAASKGSLDPQGKLRDVAQFVENFTRTWHFLSMKKKGLSDLEAAASVKKALFDYSELTPAEQIIAKRAILFYQWPRKVIPEVLSQYAQNTGRAVGLTRLATNPSQEQPVLPGFVNRGAAIPLGPTSEGGFSVLSGLGLPIAELSKFDLSSPEGGALGAVKQLLRRGGEMANPLLAGPAELALGRDFRTGRDILGQDRADPLLGKIPGLAQAIGYKEETLPSGDVRPRADPLALWALGRSPASRFLSTADQVGDLAGRAPDASALRILTGAQRFDLDKGDLAKAVEDALRSQAKALQRTGDVRSTEILFPSGKPGEKSAVGKDLVDRLRQVEKMRAAMRKEAAAPR
jgi:hypothetical protein